MEEYGHAGDLGYISREQYNNYVSHLGRRRHLAPAFNAVTPPPDPTPPPAPAPTPRPTYSAPSAPPAPTVASASSVNEVRESDKRRKGFQSTLLSKGQNPKRTRSRSKQQESKMRQGKPSYGETTKKTLLGSAS